MAEKYFSKIISEGSFASNTEAEAAYDAIWCVEPHTDDQPVGSCRDFFSDAELARHDGKFCKAILNADMGFAKRKRPTPDYKKSEEYYMKALDLVPDFCPAVSYA